MQPQQSTTTTTTNDQQPNFVLVIHGGAGTIRQSQMTPQKEQAFRTALNRALESGYAKLNDARFNALDAVEAAVRFMEDDPLFNAGKGSVFTHEGTNEMDASVMTFLVNHESNHQESGSGSGGGKTTTTATTVHAGAVAGVSLIKNPVSAARCVMEKSKHVILMGRGAEQFARQNAVEMVDDASYFYTDWRWEQLQSVIAKERRLVGGEQLTSLDHSVEEPTARVATEKAPTSETTTTTTTTPSSNSSSDSMDVMSESAEKIGTVGAVALDRFGNLAAATSTGGMTNKRFNRCGDSPMIGCGTFANDTVAISCTGHGEEIIRHVVSHDIASVLKYCQPRPTLQEACERVIFQMPSDSCGVIAVDNEGNVSMPFNTEGMYRGYIKSDGKSLVQIYKE